MATHTVEESWDKFLKSINRAKETVKQWREDDLRRVLDETSLNSLEKVDVIDFWKTLQAAVPSAGPSTAPTQAPPGPITGNKRKLDEIVLLDAKKFQADISNTTFVTSNTYVQLPKYRLLLASNRIRFPDIVAMPKVTLMHRQVSADMQTFIENHRGQPAVYIHGPQGVGKSHSLYEVVCNMKRNPEVRVIYIPDCKAWGDVGSDSAVEFLLSAVVLAFPEDEYIHGAYETLRQQEDIERFLKELPRHCKSKGLQLYAIFDQHNSLTPEQRSRFPYSIAEGALTTFVDWKENLALVVISASANNSYQLKVASDNRWPQFIMNKGFTLEEFEVWVEHEQFLQGKDLDDVKYWTNCMPLELSLLSQMARSTKDDLKELLDKYVSSRRLELVAQQQKFESEYCIRPEDRQSHVNGISWMKLGVPMGRHAMPFVLNQQLMFVDSLVVKPITPLAQEVLVGRFELDFSAAFNYVVAVVLQAPISEFSNDVKGRAFERYVLRQLEITKEFRFIAKQISLEKKPTDWTTIPVDIANCKVYHFPGTKVAENVDWSQPAIIIPMLSNYPDIDVFLFRPSDGLL